MKGECSGKALKNERAGLGFLLRLVTMSADLGPGVLFQHNGREKSSIILRWSKEKKERRQFESCTMVYAYISLRRFSENCSSMSFSTKKRSKKNRILDCLYTRLLLQGVNRVDERTTECSSLRRNGSVSAVNLPVLYSIPTRDL